MQGARRTQVSSNTGNTAPTTAYRRRCGHSQHRPEAPEERAEGVVDAASLLLPRAAHLDLGARGALAAGEVDDPQEPLLPSTLERGLVRERHGKVHILEVNKRYVCDTPNGEENTTTTWAKTRRQVILLQ